MIKNFLIVGIGGFFGSALRYCFYLFCNNQWLNYPNLKFPVSTLIVNIFGSFLVGCLSVIFEKEFLLSNQLKLLLITGFLGGFTTFSAFSLENYSLIKDGEFYSAVLNIFFNVVVGVFCVFLGVKVFSMELI